MSGISRNILETYNNIKGGVFMITYEPLWNTLKKKGISTYKLINEYHVSKGTIDSLKQNRNIYMRTLNDLCNLLDCDITDVIKYTKD